MPLTFPRKIEAYDPTTTNVNFPGVDNSTDVPCRIASEALLDHFGAGSIDSAALLAAFCAGRVRIENTASDNYDKLPDDQKGNVLLTSADF